MSTYRERREARAERLRGWADKREAKSTAAYEQAQTMASGIPLGQPIIGARDASYRTKIDGTYRRAFENADKARSMASRADSIEDQLASSIYSDDADALPRLREKLAGLEAARKRWTDYNKSARAKLKADPESRYGDLEILDEAQKRSLLGVMKYSVPRPGGAAPSYATSNLGGQISKLRQRIAQMERAEGSA